MIPVTAIDRALDAAGLGANPVTGGRRELALSNGQSTAASARVDGDWLVLTAELPFVPRAWSMLAWNARLAGGARFAGGAAAAGPALRAEIALDAGADLERRLLHAVGGFREAIACLHEHRAHVPVAEAVVDDGGALAARCRETRWPVKERGPGSVAVDLDVPGAFHQALVERRSGDHVSSSVHVLDPTATNAEPASAMCRQALGVFLVRMGSVVRMVRAAAESDVDTAPRFEVVTEKPTAVELGHAFAALSIACRLAVREAAVLRHDDAVARAYLRQCDDAVARRAA